MKLNLKTVEKLDSQQFPVKAADHPKIRALLDERDAISSRLDATRQRLQSCSGGLDTYITQKPRAEENPLQRARRFLAGDTSAADGGVQSRALGDLRQEYTQLSNEVALLESALHNINRAIETQTRRATAERLQQPDFQRAYATLHEAIQNLLKAHRDGLALAERESSRGWLVSEAGGDPTWAHLPEAVVPILEALAAGEVPYIPTPQIRNVRGIPGRR